MYNFGSVSEKASNFSAVQLSLWLTLSQGASKRMRISFPSHFFHFSDGYELPSDGRQKVFPNGTLIIEQAMKTTDEGYYTCTATSRRDDQHSGNVHIQVLSE